MSDQPIASETLSSSQNHFMRFGIRELDALIGPSHVPNEVGIRLKDTSAATSVCIVGPDGTGKSVLTLHLVSHYIAANARYMAENALSGPLPQVIYASTDLTYDKANQVWHNFGLNLPYRREKELYGFSDFTDEEYHFQCCTENDSDEDTLARYIIQQSNDAAYAYLGSGTVGDPLSFLARLLASLKKPEKGAARHLLVIDSVEAMHTLHGQLDAYGQARSRESRLTELLNVAEGKCHIVFTVGEPPPGLRSPEQMVSDYVISLRSNGGEYSHRTLEIEKARATANIRGQHAFSMRSGRGSTTAWQFNPDDRPYFIRSKPDKLTGVETKTSLSHVQVYPSLDYLDSRYRAEPHPDARNPNSKLNLEFGIEHLDAMLTGDDNAQGLPAGSVTAIIGHSKTLKAQLGRSFLSQCLNPKRVAAIPEDIQQEIKVIAQATPLKGENDPDVSQSLKDKQVAYDIVRKHLHELLKPAIGHNHTQWPGVAVLISTASYTSEELARKFGLWQEKAKPEQLDDKAWLALCESRIICRRLEAHTVSAALLIHIIRNAVDEARNILLQTNFQGPTVPTPEQFKAMGNIRVVIDNWSTLTDTYRNVREDPLFLMCLLRYLRREGVTTLVIDSQSVSAQQLLSSETESSLSRAVDHTLYTWHVPFNGRRIVAIATVGDFNAKSRTAIGEIKIIPDTRSYGRLERVYVDPHLELYQDLTTGNPRQVALKVRLFTETNACERFLAETNELFADQFLPVRGPDDLIVSGTALPVVENLDSRYNRLREFCYLQNDSLDHTVVLAVDEFWAIDESTPDEISGDIGETKGLIPTTEYLNAKTFQNGKPNHVADPFKLFQPTQHDEHLTPVNNEGESLDGTGNGNVERQRYEFFDMENYGTADNLRDRVPFTWDFGLLLCRSNAWRQARQRELRLTHPSLNSRKSNHITVADIIEAMQIGNSIRPNPPAQTANEQPPVDVPLPPASMPPEIEVQVVPPADARLSQPTPPPPNAPPEAKYPYESLKETATSWRAFLEACTVVAQYNSVVTTQPTRAFDFSLQAPESFSCLVLEVWTSEIYKTLKRRNAQEAELFARNLHSRPSQPDDPVLNLATLIGSSVKHGESLADVYASASLFRPECLKGYSLELYKAFKIIAEAVAPTDSTQTQDVIALRSRPVDMRAVAVRHWYKTASQEAEGFEIEDPVVPVRLPGHFTSRGDWFLAIAAGSRSVRLGERAVDLLSSRRSNILRLQLGVGLPTRKILGLESSDPAYEELQTHLFTVQEAPEVDVNDKVYPPYPRTRISYKDLLQIGAQREPTMGDGELHWLWRSRLKHYDRHARIWQQWLRRMLEEFNELRITRGVDWKNGFDVYDWLDNAERARTNWAAPDENIPNAKNADVRGYQSFQRFGKLCDFLTSCASFQYTCLST